MDKVIKQLQELGLSENEAKAYLAALELGPATAMQISAKAAIVRPTAYTAIGGLVKRGLMSQVKRGKKIYFLAEKPEHLEQLIALDKRRVIERENRLKKVMPVLQSLISLSGDKPEVQYYEGMEGLETMRSILLNSKAKGMDVVSSIQYEKTVPEESAVLHDFRLAKMGIRVRDIFFTEKSKQKGLTKKVENSIFQFKYVYSPHTKDFGEIAIFNDYVTLVAYLEKPYGFLIKSKQVANTARAMFEGFWGSLPKM